MSSGEVISDAIFTTCSIKVSPPARCSTLAFFDFMRVPRPAARITTLTLWFIDSSLANQDATPIWHDALSDTPSGPRSRRVAGNVGQHAQHDRGGSIPDHSTDPNGNGGTASLSRLD